MRVKKGVTARKRHKKYLKLAKGYWGRKHLIFKTAKEAVDKALKYSYRDRRARKRDFRALWIIRINAAVREFNMSYSKFMAGLNKAGIVVNRKMLAELAVNKPAAFQKLVESSKKAQGIA
ncbi:MAG: 50S ribosomal protein L20 [Deltaproteobacteria bacterium]|nr:50S ribosomal protein L20 [Deltaproteobacteria bacterium]MCL5792270.1 50S ribosomal protein L20 [Deltaproteobacteria bacterium]